MSRLSCVCNPARDGQAELYVVCAGVFRECGGGRCVLSMVQYRVCRAQSLGIIQQLILSSGGDEDLASLLGLMHTSAPDAIQLKMDIIKVVSC